MIYSAFFSQLMNGVFDNKDLSFFTRSLNSKIFRPIFITDDTHAILASHGEAIVVTSDGKIAEPSCENILKCVNILDSDPVYLKQLKWKSCEKEITGLQLPLISKKQVFGYCYIISEQELTNVEFDYLIDAIVPTLLVLINQKRAKAEKDRNQKELIRDILYNNYDSFTTLAAKARNWNWDLNGAWTLAVGEIEDGKLNKALEIANQYCVNKRRCIASWHNKQFILLIPSSNVNKEEQLKEVHRFMDRLLKSMRSHGFQKVQFGIGSFADTIEDVHKVFLEAKIALELSSVFQLGEISYFEEIGILKFVFSQSAHELQAFTYRVLGKLIEYDRDNDAELLQTMKVFFEAELQIQDCSRVLFVHENTLRNRLKKIESLTGYSLRRVDHLTNLYVAMQIAQIGKSD